MALYNNSVKRDSVLTDLSLAWPNNGFVGNKLFPTVKVTKQAAKYYTFGRESWTAETSSFRAPGTVANEIPGMGVSVDTYFAQEHALQIPIPDEERENVDNPFNPDRDATEFVTQKLLLERELAMKNLVTTIGNYATGMSVTLSGTTQFNDYVNSDPIQVFTTAKLAMHAKVFFEPNLAVIPYQVMAVLENHPKIMDRIKYVRESVLTPQIVASVLGMEEVIIPAVGLGTNTSATSISLSYLWGKDIVLAWVPPRSGLRVPAFAYEFVWGYSGKEQVVDRWREEPRKSDLIRVQRRYDLKMVGVETDPSSADYGKSITGYLIKNAIA